jgi:hypothetical protein
MAVFKWLDIWLGILGGVIALVLLWKGRNYFRVYAPDPGIWSMPTGNLLGAFWAAITAHAICGIVVHAEDKERIFYGSISLILIAVAIAVHFASVKERVRASIK